MNLYDTYSLHIQNSGQNYARYTFEQWARSTKYYIRGWLPNDRGCKVLELGCGQGNFYHLWQSLGCKNYVGVDISKHQIERFRKRFPEASVVSGDALEYLKTSDQMYDLIVAFDLLEHIKPADALELLTAACHKLTPHGSMIVQTPNGESLMGGKIRYDDVTHETCYTSMSARYLTEASGFSDFSARECGPYPHGAISLVRKAFWSCLRWGIMGYNLIETGNVGGGIYTRVFVFRCARA
jgi:2-polyprenyl-3-methyl-5-hydroxy-6-metoxy-1,4-benzoquinol methylase